MLLQTFLYMSPGAYVQVVLQGRCLPSSLLSYLDPQIFQFHLLKRPAFPCLFHSSIFDINQVSICAWVCSWTLLLHWLVGLSIFLLESLMAISHCLNNESYWLYNEPYANQKKSHLLLCFSFSFFKSGLLFLILNISIYILELACQVLQRKLCAV